MILLTWSRPRARPIGCGSSGLRQARFKRSAPGYGICQPSDYLLLFLILGSALGTAFIATGRVFAAGALAAVMVSAGSSRSILDAPLTSVGLLLGIAAIAILEIGLSVPK